jgi:hypothetical protein
MIFSPRRYVSSRPTLYQYVAKVSRDLAGEAKSFPAVYHPILTRLQYGCSTLGFGPIGTERPRDVSRADTTDLDPWTALIALLAM